MHKAPNPEAESDKDENEKRDKPIPLKPAKGAATNLQFVQTPRVTLQDVKLPSNNRIEHSRSVAMPASPLKREQMDTLAMPPSPLKRGPADDAMRASPLKKRESGAQHNIPPSSELNPDAAAAARIMRMTQGPKGNEAIHRRRPDDIYMRGPASKMNLAAAAASSDKDTRRLSKRDNGQQDQQQRVEQANRFVKGDKPRSLTRTFASLLEDGPTRWCLILILVSWSLIGVLSYTLLGPNSRKSRAAQANAVVKTVHQVQSDKHKDAFDSIESALSKTSDSVLDTPQGEVGQREALHEHAPGGTNMTQKVTGEMGDLHNVMLGEDEEDAADEAVVPQTEQTEQTPLLSNMH
ncbi:hypothetical protein HDU81_010167 [Chytriomyces hyalinus]|nr:hypothetical protein HDU81_010167 [Chytriomyces hyalinus]